MSNEIAILGVGMHPWGKWGHNFVQYGVAAAREALADAGVPWQDVRFVSGGATIRCGYPGFVAGATFAQALGWQGAEVNTSYAACASGSQALAAARNNSPVEMWGRPSSLTSSAAWVPLPDPGAPSNTIRIERFPSTRIGR